MSASTYPGQWALCGVGILLVGLGVSLEVTAGLVTLAGEGLVLALCRVFGLPFSRASFPSAGSSRPPWRGRMRHSLP